MEMAVGPWTVPAMRLLIWPRMMLVPKPVEKDCGGEEEKEQEDDDDAEEDFPPAAAAFFGGGRAGAGEGVLDSAMVMEAPEWGNRPAVW